jgi:predicted acetyltransferase
MQLQTTRVPDCPPDRVSPGWKVDLLDEGRSVSRLWIVDRIVRIRGARVKVGGISTVGTEEAYRGRGLAARVMEATLALMDREGYDATLLHGIPDFYHRFGYAVCMPEYGVRIATLDAERAPGPLELRPLRVGDLPAIADLYNDGNAWRIGTAVRDPGTWKGFPRSAGWFMKPGIRVTVDGRDRVTGYVVFDDDPSRCRASEAGAVDGDALGSILRFLARRAVDLRKENVHLALPPDHPLALYARPFGCVAEIEYPRNGGFMGRIIRFPAFLEKVAGALGREPGPLLPEGVVLMATEYGAGSLAFRDGRGSFAALPSRGEEDCAYGPNGGGRSPEGCARFGPGAFFQMAMGYRSARDLSAAGKLQATADQLDLLEAWFPLRHATMYWADRF